MADAVPSCPLPLPPVFVLSVVATGHRFISKIRTLIYLLNLELGEPGNEATS